MSASEIHELRVLQISLEGRIDAFSYLTVPGCFSHAKISSEGPAILALPVTLFGSDLQPTYL